VFSSSKGDWRTPPELFARLDRQWGAFEVDAAATTENALCNVFFDTATNALSESVDWGSYGRKIWLNPPYGRDIGQWVAKAYEQSKTRVRVVMLLPARTDTKWWHEYVKPYAFNVEFLRGRVRFSGSKTGAPFPSAIVVFDGLGR
jgi:site-specific DNA-methyltransferase (adenine-specific)